jgi:hypothetical protein
VYGLSSGHDRDSMSLLSNCTGRSLIEVSQISFLRRCPKILLPILWCPVAIGINAMHRLGVAALASLLCGGGGG